MTMVFQLCISCICNLSFQEKSRRCDVPLRNQTLYTNMATGNVSHHMKTIHIYLFHLNEHLLPLGSDVDKINIILCFMLLEL